MSRIALGLLLASAVLHALWNLLLKQAREKQIAAWGAMLAGSICFLPVLLVGRWPPRHVWPYGVASALFEVAYFKTLTDAYRLGDFSLIYPVARGTVPLFLTVWAVLFLRESLSPAGLAGLGTLTVGLMVVGGSGWLGRKRAAAGLTGISTALVVAMIISILAAIDGAAVKKADAAPYTVLVFWLSSLLVAPMIIGRHGWSVVRAELQSEWLRIGTVGCLSMASYMLALFAYSLAPVGYAGAVREITVVFGALAGWLWLGEGMGAVRLVGAAIIFAGMMIIAAAG
ncbi:MAG TPA: DMT family transporter [Blastocatellia bacterium]|nr:DMT family transporter [Blastocatellia bacterium]